MNKKELVIETARELFSKYGYKKVSMDEIAQTSKVTKKTIYTYFKDKDSLFSYFVKEELEKMKQQFEIQKQKNISFLEFVSSSVYCMLIYRKNSVLISKMLEEAKDEKSKVNQFLKLYDDEIIKYIEENIKEAIKLNNIKKCDTHLTAFIIYKVYIDVMFEYDKELDEKQVTKEITSILKNGLLN
jgi:AcrR family transcriptional regulator